MSGITKCRVDEESSAAQTSPLQVAFPVDPALHPKDSQTAMPRHQLAKSQVYSLALGSRSHQALCFPQHVLVDFDVGSHARIITLSCLCEDPATNQIS